MGPDGKRRPCCVLGNAIATTRSREDRSTRARQGRLARSADRIQRLDQEHDRSAHSQAGREFVWLSMVVGSKVGRWPRHRLDRQYRLGRAMSIYLAKLGPN